MTLDEAIRHAEEVAEYDCYNDEQKKCADEHRQLAEWLKELKECQSFIAKLPSAQKEIVRCKECKHRHLDGMIWDCPFGLTGGEDFFCAYGAKGGDSDDE